MTTTAGAIRFAWALSDAAPADAALQAVAAQLGHQDLGRADLVLFFATAAHRHSGARIGARLTALTEARVVAGCTAQGVIGVRREIEDGPGLAVLAARLGHAHVRPFVLKAGQWTTALSSPQALRERMAADAADVRAVLVLPDPFSTPVLRLVETLGQAFEGAVVVGGVASAAQAGENQIFINGQIYAQGAVGLVLAGPVRVDCVVSQGCRPIGRPLVVTRAKRNIVMELGGRKVLGVLQQVVGELDAADRELVAGQGLLIGRVIDEYKPRFGRGDFLVRGIMGLDEGQGYLAVGDPQLRVGQTVQFHLRDARTAAEDLHMLLEGQSLHAPPAGALLFSCSGRGAALFERADADAQAVAEVLGEVPLAGFFAGGEIGPVGGRPFVHGHTACLTLFRSLREED